MVFKGLKRAEDSASCQHQKTGEYWNEFISRKTFLSH